MISPLSSTPQEPIHPSLYAEPSQVELHNILDLQQIQHIVSASNHDANFLCDVLVMFEESTRRSLYDLTKAIQNDNFTEAKRLAHHIKGAAANVGAYQLRRSSVTLELLCAGNLRSACLQQHRILQREFQNFSDLLILVRSNHVDLITASKSYASQGRRTAIV